MRKMALLAAALTAVVTSAAFAADPGFEPGDCRLGSNVMPGTSGTVRNVPADYQTIQAAVDAAAEGDLILVAPGTYSEHVKVTTPGLRIRGTSRHGVVLDGQNLKANGIEITADRVMVDNMTGHNYRGTAFFWHDQTGYWGRGLTAYNNGTYGVYAYKSRCGQFDYSTASGNGDSGFYIGGCFPCDAVIEHIESVRNALGYSGTNAGGNLTLRDSSWYHNGLGIVPNSHNGEPHPPQRGITIAYNDVFDNNGADVPGTGGVNNAFFGGGIVVAGGAGNEVFGNNVNGNAMGGIILAPLPDPPNPEYSLYPLYIPQNNAIWGNTVTGPAGSFALVQAAASGPGNCWQANSIGTLETAPPMLQEIWNCGLPTTPPGGDPRLEVQFILGAAGANGRTQANPFTYPFRPCNLPGGTIVDPPVDTATCADSSGAALTEWLPALALS